MTYLRDVVLKKARVALYLLVPNSQRHICHVVIVLLVNLVAMGLMCQVAYTRKQYSHGRSRKSDPSCVSWPNFEENLPGEVNIHCIEDVSKPTRVILESS